MVKEKWDLILSTTEPYNHIGLIKVRKENINTETVSAKIIENNLPYDLTGLKVYFCAYFERYIPVEQESVIVDAKAGKISYTLNKYDMQGKLRFAYFRFEKDGVLVGTSQNFLYTIISSIESNCMDSGPYIQRLEDVLNLFSNVKEESMKEIQAIIEAFNEQVLQQQQDFDAWFESIRGILESIDPGGLLLSEIIRARKSFKSLDERLDSDKNELKNELEDLRWSHYTVKFSNLITLRTLKDDLFSVNHELLEVDKVASDKEMPALIIAEVDSKVQDTFYLQKVGEV